MMTRTIRTGIAAAALLLAPIAAQAADLRQPSYKSPAYVAPAYASWTGFYVGLNAGYGFGKSNWDFPASTNSPKGVLAGGTIGYNFQTGTWVWGVEGDFDYSGMKGTSDCAPGVTCETKNSWLGTARARLGYAGWNNWLPYITGGLAMGDIKATNSARTSANKTKMGYTLGAGVEYAMWSNWSVKLEYLYVDLGKFDCGIACSTTVPDNVSFKANIVRAGLNYRF
ncbi:MAG TPA: outer membrane protein [Pseudolabrys sp.]